MNEKNNQPANRKIIPFDQRAGQISPSKSKVGSIISSIVFSIGVFLTCLSLFSLFQALHKQSEVNNQLVEAEERLNKIKTENKQAKKEYELSKDKDYIAKLARKDYFFSKDNEIIFNLNEETSEQ
ncbi:septum formation initiator family protein [Facklamia sp. 7083-14-GEN3]|uniref:FtsB family cell division protein n=1 Tax=Facklamia sp. 7083-14-GEN3 TaxID=2973478 RepID=UPI00215BC0CA|nr:septum formation initiator family protein [Facklamia sp. 7083-14-GEN3]MCR8969670.1 septum formation initiator family protein [Facklamia sp. 7083-14-GEN3]